MTRANIRTRGEIVLRVDDASCSVGTRLEHSPHGGSCVCVHGSTLAIVVCAAQHDSHIACGGMTSISAKSYAFAPRGDNASDRIREDRNDLLLWSDLRVVPLAARLLRAEVLKAMARKTLRPTWRRGATYSTLRQRYSPRLRGRDYRLGLAE